MEVVLLAIALSMDCSALCMALSAKYRNLRVRDYARVATAFAFFQGAMPCLGFLLGKGLVGIIQQIDHFIAFAILAFLGIKMIRESFSEGETELPRMEAREIWLGAFATSIDALAVGVTFAFDGAPIAPRAAAIAAICFAISMVSFAIGRKIGNILQSKALILGGAVLIAIGLKILITDLFF